MKYRGKIFSGIGVAQTRIADNLILYEKKTGLRFFPGTLNVRLTEDFVIPDDKIFISAEEITTIGHKTDISLVPVKLYSEQAFVLCPHISMYDPCVIEIMTTYCIRDKYSLNDSDYIEVEL